MPTQAQIDNSHKEQKQVCYVMFTIRQTISLKSKLGKPVAGELDLLNSWLTYPDYRKADTQNLRDGRYADLSVAALQNLDGLGQ